MLRRRRKYRCSKCGKVLVRVSDKQWFLSLCNDSCWSRCYLVKKVRK